MLGALSSNPRSNIFLFPFEVWNFIVILSKKTPAEITGVQIWQNFSKHALGIKKLQISVLYEVFIYQLRIVFCGSDLWFFVIFRMRPPAEIFTDKLTGNKIKIFEINSLKRFPLILRISKQDMKTCTKNNDTKWLRIKILLVEKSYLSTARATVSDKVLNSVANSEIQI